MTNIGRDPDKVNEYEMPGFGKVVWNAGMTLMKVVIPAGSGMEAYLEAEKAHPGMGIYFAVGVPIIEVAAYLWFKNAHRDTKVEVEEEKNYLSTILKKEVANYAPFTGKLGEVDKEGSLAWMIDQTGKNYGSAREHQDDIYLPRQMAVDSYKNILKLCGMNETELFLVDSFFPDLKIKENSLITAKQFFDAYDASNKELGLQEKITEFVRTYRGETQPSEAITSFVEVIYNFSQGLNAGLHLGTLYDVGKANRLDVLV